MTLNIMIFSIKPDGIMTLSIIMLSIIILITMKMLCVIITKTNIKAK
jgi:hypothetical protein